MLRKIVRRFAGKTKYQTPHKGGRAEAVAAFGLLLPPASRPPPRAAPRLRGVPPPDPLWLRPLCASRRTAPLHWSIKSKGGRKGGGQPEAVHGPQQPPPQARASEARQAEGVTPVGKGGGRPGDVGSFAVHMSRLTPRLSIGQGSHGRGAQMMLRFNYQQLHATHRVRRPLWKAKPGLEVTDKSGGSTDRSCGCTDKKA